MTRSRSVLLFVATVGACLLPLTHRVLWRGEFHSVSELIFSSYPWAYDDPSRTPLDATNFDLAVFDYPLLKMHWGRLKAGDFPDWDPLLIGGGPAFFQQLNTGQAFSPVHLPLYLLPFDLGYTVSVWMRPVGAASFMYLFLRHAGVGTAGTIAGSVAFGFTSPFTVSLASAIPAVGLFLPLTILLAERVARFCRAIDVAALGIVLGLQFTVVYLPTSIVVVATTMAYAAWWIDRDAWRRAAVRLAIAGVTGIAVGAVALVPMLVSLSASPVLDRSMADVRPLVSDLVTFALPGFWGNPRSHNWWHPAGGHYREVVQYLGVVPLIFAAAGAAWAIQRRERRGLFFAGLAALAMLYMYDVPPVAWLRDLPGLRPMNPLRANVALAIASAALTAYGVDWLAQRAHAADRRERRVIMASTLLVGLALASTAALVTYHYLPTIRNLHLQDFEKRGLARFAILAVAALALVVVAVRSSPRQTQAASGGAAAGPIRLSLVGFVAVLDRKSVV